MDRNQQLNVVFNTVAMMRMRSKRTVMLTESSGDTDLYKKFVGPTCFVSSANNRSGVIELLERLANNRVPAAVGIVDSDDDFALNRKSPRDDVARTDATDKETTIMASNAFEDFCISERATLPFEQIRREVFSAVMPLGLIRRYSAIEDWGLDFKPIRVQDFLTLNVTCDLHRCMDAVLQANPHIDITKADLQEAFAHADLKALAVAQIVRGHDATAVLACRSRELFQAEKDQREIEEGLSRAYERRHFDETGTCAHLKLLEAGFPAGFTLFT